MEVCENCKEISFDACSTVIQVETGLSAGSYQAWLLDKFDNYHVITSTVNANGDASIDLTSYDITFTPYSGSFKLTFRESTAYDEDLPLNIAGNSYGCILLSFYNRS